MFECAGEKPIEDEEESTENDIGNDEFNWKKRIALKMNWLKNQLKRSSCHGALKKLGITIN